MNIGLTVRIVGVVLLSFVAVQFMGFPWGLVIGTGLACLFCY